MIDNRDIDRIVIKMLESGFNDNDIDMVESAMKKQVPKTIKINRWIYTECDCGYEFSTHYGDGYYDVDYRKRTNYCPNCGDKLIFKEGDD